MVRKYAELDAERAVSMGASTAETLKELEKKLVSINRRNRLLYLPRTSAKYALDLFDGEHAVASRILFGAGATVADVLHPLSETAEAEAGKYRRIVQLLREVNKDLREKGQNDLYIGYPFVIGRLPGEDFDVRAPLALFPVSAERSATSIELTLDESRDIVFNTTLILAHYKFSNLSKPLPSEAVESATEADFLDCVLNFLRKAICKFAMTAGIAQICRVSGGRISAFCRWRARARAVRGAGKFPICASSIQKDFDEILQRNEINALLNDLLQGMQDRDFYAEDGAERLWPPVGGKMFPSEIWSTSNR